MINLSKTVATITPSKKACHLEKVFVSLFQPNFFKKICSARFSLLSISLRHKQWLSFDVAIAAGPRLHCSPPSFQLTHSCCSTYHSPMPESLFLVGKARSSSIQTSTMLSSSSFIQPAAAWRYNASNLGNH